ncbi:MAG TPA: KEOPS complex N(6)-L-threonylcarbamoyladenine synthase Kae1 [Candidatus Bathyarchaeia archaeon]|nr:KEOPS complex N(6)-L-threonylcarbamoyladenine synthase Kae1 [Candidatus Bathyarchaeia archaeon]
MRCLGIESTAHTFGASIVTDAGAILSDVRDVHISAAGSGIHPREAAEHHSEVAGRVVGDSLKQAGISADNLDAVAIALGPGLGPCLRVGATVARSLASYLRIPLVPVNHAIGHIEIGILTTKARDPLVVLVSGGHTAITAFSGGRWRIFGETEDITIGNLYDMFAREIKLPSPAGPQIEGLARKASTFITLPYVVKGNDVSYSGLLTASLARLSAGDRLEDVCYSMQEVACSMLAEAVERSLAYTGKKNILVTGGVAANKSLQEKLEKVAEIHNATTYTVKPALTGDNGAQIAWTGVLSMQAGLTTLVQNSRVKPKWRLEDVDIPWRT